MGFVLSVKGRPLDKPKQQRCLWIHFQLSPGVPSLESAAGKDSGLGKAGGDTQALGMLAWKEQGAGTWKCQFSALSLPGAARVLWFP